MVAARQRLERAGIRACYFLQFGYPGETWRDIELTVSLVRRTRPYDIGVSVSYPLPNTVFYQKVQAELGSKRNWTDSDDLCVMFTAEYQDVFYHAIRDALHAEVDSWRNSALRAQLPGLWRRVRELEPASRNACPTRLRTAREECTNDHHSQFLPVYQIAAAVGEA